MKKKMLLILAVVCMIAAAALTGCTGGKKAAAKAEPTKDATSYPLELTDDLGNAVTVKAAPVKVVSLSPANTEIICALGARNNLVGRTDYCDYPADVASVESIGDYYAPNVEKIISLSPNMVIGSEYMDGDVKSQLEGAGITVACFCAYDIDGVEQDILKIAQALDKNSAAYDLVNNMETARKELKDRCAKAPAKRSVFIDLGDYYSSGDGSLQDNMLKEINAQNIAGGTGETVVQLSVEQIIKSNPDVYVSQFTGVDELKKVPGFDTLNAVKENRITAYDFMDPFCSITSRPGPRVIEGMTALAKLIYPELF